MEKICLLCRNEFLTQDKGKIFCPKYDIVLARWFLTKIEVVELNLKKGDKIQWDAGKGAEIKH